MNKNITSFFVANKDNVTVAFESNMADFIKVFQNVEPEARNYQYYYRQFQKGDSFDWNGYHFQQLV
ncbi:hypothetical protein [Flagellimonas sp. CMM7]|uniref:hypothetical protein n=1 Tax=Flagellimonas sp. CMM7 TaxID=2654676 RepID=UPI0013CF5242|nr:hypothetical protein [Flagellimonas sp. CMM7]UII80027.1 hypothetical protein LV704_00550 [Flagellimonas sp. CMM7]